MGYPTLVGEFSRDYSYFKPELRRSNWVIYFICRWKRCFFKSNSVFNNAVFISRKKSLEDWVSRTSLTLKNKSIFLHIFMVWWVIFQRNLDDRRRTYRLLHFSIPQSHAHFAQSKLHPFLYAHYSFLHPSCVYSPRLYYPMPVGTRQVCPMGVFSLFLSSGLLWSYSLKQQQQQRCAHSVPLAVQDSFRHAGSGKLVSREELMIILSRLDGLHIRALYFTESQRLTLGEVGLEEATSEGSGSIAHGVEMCACPPQYVGDSCQVGDIHLHMRHYLLSFAHSYTYWVD